MTKRRDGAKDHSSTEGVGDLKKIIVRTFWLRVISGPDEKRTFRSTDSRVVVGTHESASFVLEDPTVSRFHFEIVLGDRAVIRDLGSRNGTAVGGISVIEAHLPESANITIGRTTLVFGYGDDHIAIPASENASFGRLVGASIAMRRAFALMEKVASSNATVVIEGETGTGKEVAAESIHEASDRRDRPFLVVDCSAIPEGLLESELFGHERGAFTGAVAPREGVFEAANGGTIFLDEIGELALDLQPKLLRVLEKREVKRVGSNRYIPADVRVIAATNRNLRARVNDKTFRADLFYRLAVVEIRLPPLRERRDDLSLLVDALLKASGASEEDIRAVRDDDLLAALARHEWPGNVRELRNYLERCVALRERPPLALDPKEGGPFDVSLDQPLPVARERWSREMERRYITGILERAEGNVTAAARAAGVDRMYFYRLLWRHGLKEKG